MSAQKLILVLSTAMDNNKKEGRAEKDLIRMSARTRSYMGFDTEFVEISNSDRAPVTLQVFKAFAEDIQWAKDNYSTEETRRVGFVTTETLALITGKTSKSTKNDIWITNKAEDTVFGSDPEFLILNKDNNEIVHAGHLLSSVGELGSDGAMAELRPGPAKTPEGLVLNIKNILKKDKYKEIVDGYLFKCACYEENVSRDFPVGGHIHVGNPCQIIDVPLAQRKLIYNTVNKIIDELLAVPMSKLDLGLPGRKRRTSCKVCLNSTGGYGHFGELRLAKNNNQNEKHYRLEHRTLSGMWLIHPTVAEATLGVAKAIIDEVWLRLAANNFSTEYAFNQKYEKTNVWSPSFDKWKEFSLCKDMGCTSSSSTMIEMLHSCDPKLINKTYLKNWVASLKNLSTYKKYEKHILSLQEILSVSPSEFEKFDRIIQKNWLGTKKFITE